MRSRARGFTLLELLVVVGIIALLMAILFPVIGAVYRSVKEYQCQNNMHELAKVIMAYADNFDGSFPFCGNPTGVGTSPTYTGPNRPSANDWVYVGGSPIQNNLDAGVLFRNHLVGTRDVFYCPADRSNGFVRTKSTAIRIGAIATNNPVTSYAINGSITYGDAAPPLHMGVGASDTQRHVRKISDFKPTDFMFIEESDDSNWSNAWFQPNSSIYMLAGDPTASPRHRGGGFVSCMDGHVEWFAHRPSDTTGMTQSQIDATFEATEDHVYLQASGNKPWYDVTTADVPMTTTYIQGNRWNPN